jgi:hypothetical protein
LITITSKEAEYLRSKGRGFDVHVTSKTHKSRGKKYWLTTRYRSVQLLNDYRKSRHQTDLYKSKNKQDFRF